MIPGYPSAPVAAVETSLQQVMGDLLAEPASAVRVEGRSLPADCG